MTAEQPAAEKPKKSITLSRVILVVILIAAVAALVMDFMAKRSMNAAYTRLSEASDQAEDTLKPLKKDAVQTEVGRAPDHEEKSPGKLIQQYDFPGVFYKHRLEVEYSGEDMMGFKQESVFRFGGK